MSKQHAYCNLYQFLEAREPEFAKLVELTCHADKLSGGFSKSGLTLLVPDAGTVKKILAMAESGDRKQLRDACAHVAALILRGGFKTAKDLQASKGGIGNSQWPSQQVKITKFDPVTFESGATATPYPAFVDGSESENFAVWSLKGELPPTQGKDLPKMAKAKGGKRGGYDEQRANELSSRQRNNIALAIEQTLVDGDDTQMRGCAHSLLKWVLTHSSDESRKLAAAARCCLHPCDLYFLLEPHLESGWLIDDGMIADWWAAVQTKNAPQEGVCAIFQQYIKTTDDEITKLQKIRDDCLRAVCNNFVETNKYINEAYTLAGMDGHKRLCDEMRFLAICQLDANKVRPDRVVLNNTLNQIAEMQSAWDSHYPERALLFSENGLDLSANKNYEAQAFIKSSCFLFVPMLESQHNKKESCNIVPLTENKVWNVSWQGYDTHKRLLEQAERKFLAAAASLTPAQRKAAIEALSK